MQITQSFCYLSENSPFDIFILSVWIVIYEFFQSPSLTEFHLYIKYIYSFFFLTFFLFFTLLVHLAYLGYFRWAYFRFLVIIFDTLHFISIFFYYALWNVLFLCFLMIIWIWIWRRWRGWRRAWRVRWWWIRLGWGWRI